MSFWIAGAIVVTTVGSHTQQRRAQKKAEKTAKADALEADKQARKAEVFAETEGEGVGQLGKVSLEVDDDELDENVSSNLRI